MYRFKPLIGMAVLGAAAATLPAAAQEDERRSVEVGIADLDLSTPAGQASLDRRVELALRKVCPVDARPDLRQQAQARACRAQAMREIEPRLAALTGGGAAQMANREANIVAAR